jgi:hypothetical protein
MMAQITENIDIDGSTARRRDRAILQNPSNLACNAGGSSPISSRNSVPPSARWILPGAALPFVPVIAASSKPNNSAAISASGIAAQFKATNSCAARGPLLWIARANHSLPVPVSLR